MQSDMSKIVNTKVLLGILGVLVTLYFVTDLLGPVFDKFGEVKQIFGGYCYVSSNTDVRWALGEDFGVERDISVTGTGIPGLKCSTSSSVTLTAPASATIDYRPTFLSSSPFGGVFLTVIDVLPFIMFMVLVAPAVIGSYVAYRKFGPRKQSPTL